MKSGAFNTAFDTFQLAPPHLGRQERLVVDGALLVRGGAGRRGGGRGRRPAPAAMQAARGRADRPPLRAGADRPPATFQRRPLLLVQPRVTAAVVVAIVKVLLPAPAPAPSPSPVVITVGPTALVGAAVRLRRLPLEPPRRLLRPGQRRR